MSNKIKRAFTLVELITTVLIMVFVSFAAFSVTFNKAKTQKKVVKYKTQNIICDAEKAKKTGYCRIDITSVLMSKEFLDITLIGGGAGGSNYKGGQAGEEKHIIYPSLVQPFGYSYSSDKKGTVQGKPACDSPMCELCPGKNKNVCKKCVKGYKVNNGTCEINFYYRAYLGKGGKAGKPGGQTSLVAMKKDDNTVLGVLEFASGGFSPWKKTECDKGDDNCAKGEQSSSATGGGNGGDKNKPGQPGEVIIRW